MAANWRRLAFVRQSRSWALLVFVAGLVIAALAWWIADGRVREDARSKAEAAMFDAADSITRRLIATYDVIYGVQGLFRASDAVTRTEFERFVSGLDLSQRHPSIRSIVYAVPVRGEDKAAFEAAIRDDRSVTSEGFPGYAIKPAGERPAYMPIKYIEPFAGNEKGLGLDVYTEERRESVERARDTGEPSMSGRMPLVTDPARQPGFSVRLAVYKPGMPLGSVDERRAAFSDVLGITFRALDAVGDVLTRAALASVGIRLYDRLEIAGSSTLGARHAEYTLFEKPARAAFSPWDPHYFNRSIPIEVGGRQWQIEFTGVTTDFMTPTDRVLPWILLAGGLIVSALLAGLIHSLASSGERAQTLAARITEDLRNSEAKLAEAQRLTESMIEALPNPIFVKDEHGRYRGVNRAWERFFGIDRHTFIGKTVYDLYPEDQALARRLDGWDHDLIQRRGTLKYDLALKTPTGGQHDAVVYKAAYASSNGKVAGLIGTIIDISERKRVERRQAMEHAVTRVLADAESLDIAVPKIIQTICEAMGWHYGDRYVLEPEAGVFRCLESWAADTPEIQAFARAVSNRVVTSDATGNGLVRRTLRECRPVWISDMAKEDGLRRKDLLAQAGLHGAFAFPLTAGSQVLGVMEFFHRDVREPDATLIEVAESIGRQIGQFVVRMQVEQAVKFVAMHDALTGLPNRVMFNERLEHAIANAKRNKRQLAVMFIDLDRFKIINDTLGHESGDILLREVARRITESLRTSDIVARLGGDEFVVLLEGVENPVNVAAVAEKLIAALTGSFAIGEREVHVTASIGVSNFPADAQDMRSLLRFADIAMYRAKEQGRNMFQFYSDQIDVHSIERLTLESQLRGALAREELVLFYQPVFDAQSGAVTGMEALVRWQHPDAGILPPAKFIDIAEETGLIVPIGRWVLERACEMQRTWIEQGLPPVRIAVNLSPRQFVHRNLVHDVAGVLTRTGCDPRLIVLELTETTVMHNAARATELLGELKAMGMRIAIDDFGTGYSSLAYLKRFPIDSLKIDRSFVADVPRDAGNTAITQAILAMAHSLGL
ncbi:MAG: bifunctional diguanylate cyclase/phosphodiesterase, partial [Burkholderiales bacterium]